MDISIIICTRNRAAHLRLTLQSLAQTEIPIGFKCELLVIDNASVDETAQVVNDYAVPQMPTYYVREPERGLSRARNCGLRHSQGDIILFSDDDVRFSNDWIIGMSTPICHGRSNAVAGGVKIAPHLERTWMQPMHRALFAEPMENSAPALVGANMAFSRTVLSQVPQFDPELGAGALGIHEETLFSRQISESGYTIFDARFITVEHHFQEDRLLRTNLFQAARNNGRSSAYMMYHWEHEDFHAVRLQIIRKRIQMALWRYLHPHQLTRTEGMELREMHDVRSLHLYKQILFERRRPRRYLKHGCALLDTH